MRFLFLLLFSTAVFSSTLKSQLYSGYVSIDDADGYHSGVFFQSNSNDQSLNLEVGLKYTSVSDIGLSQHELYLGLDRRLSGRDRVSFSYTDIEEDKYGGNLYVFGYANQYDGNLELNAKFGILDYDLYDSYQLEGSARSTFNSTFYYKHRYIGALVKESGSDKYYSALELEVGMQSNRYLGKISSFIGEKRYTLQDPRLFTWNLGNIHKRGLKVVLGYEIQKNTAIKVAYLNDAIELAKNKKDVSMSTITFLLSHSF